MSSFKTLGCVAALAFALVSGCATKPPITQEQLASLNYGSPPENYESIVRDAARERLKDPDSAQFKFGQRPFRAFLELNDGLWGGYIVCFEVNAKNAYGGYVGYVLSYAAINDGRVKQVMLGGTDAFDMQIIQPICSGRQTLIGGPY